MLTQLQIYDQIWCYMMSNMIKYDVTLYFKRPLQTYNYNFVSSTNSHESISTVRLGVVD